MQADQPAQTASRRRWRDRLATLGPDRQPVTYWVFLVWAVVQGIGSIAYLIDGQWGLGLFNVAVTALLASVPFRLAR